MEKAKLSKWVHIAIENGKWIKRWFEQDMKRDKEPQCVGSIQMPLELARKAGL